MKLALLLPGYLDSPDYLHMKTFEKRLKELGYIVERLDPCHLWETGNVSNYSITNYIAQIRERVEFYQNQNPEEVVLIGHSLGGFTAIIAGNRIKEVTKIVSLCPPPDREVPKEEWGEVRHSERDLPENPAKLRSFDIPYSFVEDGVQYVASEEVKEIHKPLMIFISLDDKTVLPEHTEEIVANANNPHVVRMPNMGHSFRRSQQECDIVTAEIEKFLQQDNPKNKDMKDIECIKLAIEEAKKSEQNGGAPIGAVLVKDGEVIATGWSLVWPKKDPSAHGETECLRNACQKLNTIDLSGCTLYSTLESCSMCLGCAAWSGVSRIVFGAYKQGIPPNPYELKDYNAEEHGKRLVTYDGRSISVEGGVLREECAQLMKKYKNWTPIE